MPVDHAAVQDTLADAWDRWSHRCAILTPAEWAADTRCDAWDVRALVAHMCPDAAMFDAIADAAVEGPAAVRDPAELLRRFNSDGGAAHTMADELAATATAEATALSPLAAADRFAEGAARLRADPWPGATVISHPVVGSTTLAVTARLALLEATVHMLDLADAVGGVEPSYAALTLTRDLLIDVPTPAAAVEMLAGRAAAHTVVPVIR
jgi:uncharacterized protein (TIGR03083 family)